MRKYWLYFALTFQKIFEYRLDMLIYAVNAVLAPIIGFIVWLSAASSGATFLLNKSELVTYFLLVIFVNSCTFSWHAWFLAEDIKWGRINKYLLKPLPIITEYAISASVQRLFRLFFVIIALICLYIYLVGGPNFTFNIFQIILFSLSLVMAIIIAFNIESITGILAFWTTDVEFMIGFLNLLSNLLSGKIIPLLFLPSYLTGLATILPFRYTIAFPAEIVIGKLNQSELVFGILIQFFWLIVTLILYKFILQKGIKAYTAYGA